MPGPTTLRHRLLAILALVLVATGVSSASTITRLDSAGTRNAEYLAFTHERPGVAEPLTVVRMREAGAALDEWTRIAVYTRPLLALAVSDAGEVAILLDVNLPAEGEEPSTRPATTPLRLIPPTQNRSTPPTLATATEIMPPPPPGGLGFRDIAYDGTTLVGLAVDGSIWQLPTERGNRSWTAVANAPDGVPALDGTSIGVVDSTLYLAVATAEATSLYQLVEDAWQALGTFDIDARLLDAQDVLLAAKPSGHTQSLATQDGTLTQVTWTLPESLSVSDDDRVTGTFAAGRLRITRGIATDRGVGLVRLDLDPTTLNLVTPDGIAVPLPVTPNTFSPLAETIRLLLYALLVVAVLGMLLQGRRQSIELQRSRDQEPDDRKMRVAPWRLRLAAGGVDLLPLVFTAGVVTSDPGVASSSGGTALVLAGIAAYVLLPLIGELAGGRSPGKAIFGLRVRQIDGELPASMGVLIRNVVRPVDLLGGWIAMFFAPERRRMGDLAAGTIVVYEPVGTQPQPPADQ
ncbi:MAG: RDD family protein [Planctomycetota bacterium]